MITVITGAPCSGKSTYLQQHALPGDIVIDFDVIAQAIGGTSRHDHDPRLREITVAAWAAAIREIAGKPQAQRAWIIDSRPSPQRQALYSQARARVVRLEADAAELHRRADADGRAGSIHASIERWLASDPAPASRTHW